MFNIYLKQQFLWLIFWSHRQEAQSSTNNGRNEHLLLTAWAHQSYNTSWICSGQATSFIDIAAVAAAENCNIQLEAKLSVPYNWKKIEIWKEKGFVYNMHIYIYMEYLDIPSCFEVFMRKLSLLHSLGMCFSQFYFFLSSATGQGYKRQSCKWMDIVYFEHSL